MNREVRRKARKKTFSDKVSEKIDGIVNIFSPRRAYNRLKFRTMRQYGFASYKGADQTRIRENWLPGSNSADADILPDLPRMRERSRDLNRNDPIASGVTLTNTVNVIGTGIRPQSNINAEILGITKEQADKVKKQQEYSFHKWVQYSDAGERMFFYEQEELIYRQILENGEAFVLNRRLDKKYRPYMFALDVIEADRIETPHKLRGDKSIRAGIKIGINGEAVEYYVRKTHPGDNRSFTKRNINDYMVIPARQDDGTQNIIHLYWIQRPGQTRGVPFFAPVLNKFKDMADWFEAEIIAERIAACYALFIETPDPYDTAEGSADGTNAGSQRLQEFEPGLIEYLAPGEKITSFAPNRPGDNFDPFVERLLRMIGASLGIPYELIAKDFSKTNYSSARASLLEARRFFKQRQEWFAQKLCQPVYEMVMEEAYLNNELDIDNFYSRQYDWTRARWIAPGWEWVDPIKEVKASVTAIENGLTTYADEIAKTSGKDYEEQFEQLAREREKMKALGILPAGQAPQPEPVPEPEPEPEPVPAQSEND